MALQLRYEVLVVVSPVMMTWMSYLDTRVVRVLVYPSQDIITRALRVCNAVVVLRRHERSSVSFHSRLCMILGIDGSLAAMDRMIASHLICFAIWGVALFLFVLE